MRQQLYYIAIIYPYDRVMRTSVSLSYIDDPVMLLSIVVFPTGKWQGRRNRMIGRDSPAARVLECGFGEIRLVDCN